MEVTITVDHFELIRAIQDFLPMRLLLGRLEGSDDPTWVQIDAVGKASFVPRRGVHVSCAARVHYPLPVVPDDFTVSHARLEMTPAIVRGPGGAALAFELRLGAFERAYLPDFIDLAVANKINAALREHASSIAWDFSHTLTRIVELPGRLQGVRTLELGAPRGLVEVTDRALVLHLSIDASFHHAGAAVDVPPSRAGRPTQPWLWAEHGR